MVSLSFFPVRWFTLIALRFSSNQLTVMPAPRALDSSLLINRKVWGGPEAKTCYSVLTWHCLALVLPQQENTCTKNPEPCWEDYLELLPHSRQWHLFIFLISHLLCNSLWGFKLREWVWNVSLFFTAFTPAYAGYFRWWFLCRRNNELYESNVFTAVENYSLATNGSRKTLKPM